MTSDGLSGARAMLIDGRPSRTIWPTDDGAVEIIDQTVLPHRVEIVRLRSLTGAARAIVDMQVRGAPLIGATAAWGLTLALRADPSDQALARAVVTLAATRPTAVNLAWALERVRAAVAPLAPASRAGVAASETLAIVEEDVAACRAIGENHLGSGVTQRAVGKTLQRGLQFGQGLT